jgi:outer membrane immunogenic protein
MKKYLVLFSAISALMSAPASAADMPLKAPPMPAPVFSWTGPYIGAQGGFGWANDTWIFPNNGQFFTVGLPGPSSQFSTSPKGALAGGEIGYYIGMNGTPIVFGFELAGDWTDVKQTVVGPFAPVFPNDAFTTKLRDLETYMARAGIAFGNWLWYVEAGAGSGRIELSGLSGAPGAGVAFTTSERGGGIAVGGGIDTVWAQHLLLGVEYKYVDLGSFGTRPLFGTCTVAATCGVVGALIPVTVGDGSNGFHVQTVLGRLGYKF